MGLMGGDNESENNRDDAINPYPERQPDFRATELFDLNETQNLMQTTLQIANDESTNQYRRRKVDEPKDRSYETVQKTDDGLITDATVVFSLNESIYDKDLDEDFNPPEGCIWTHLYGREQKTGQMATEMYTFDFNSKKY